MLDISLIQERGVLDQSIDIHSVPPLESKAPSTRTRLRSALYDPNSKPLEQNEKNLYCDGTAFKVVREHIDPRKMFINVS